jgi:hypothetical protein
VGSSLESKTDQQSVAVAINNPSPLIIEEKPSVKGDKDLGTEVGGTSGTGKPKKPLSAKSSRSTTPDHAPHTDEHASHLIQQVNITFTIDHF